MSMFPSYACGSQSEHVCFFLMDRSEGPQPSHHGQQDGSLHSQLGRCAAWSSHDPANPLQRSTIRVRSESSKVKLQQHDPAAAVDLLRGTVQCDLASTLSFDYLYPLSPWPGLPGVRRWPIRSGRVPKADRQSGFVPGIHQRPAGPASTRPGRGVDGR